MHLENPVFDNSKEIQNQIDIVELTIDESKKEIKKEDNFIRKLELNMKIKIVEEKIQQLVDEILVWEESKWKR